jgi:flagellar protein FlgJ
MESIMDLQSISLLLQSIVSSEYLSKPSSAVSKPLSAKEHCKFQDLVYDYKHNFIQSLWPIAQQVASTIGLDPKILIAQAALETGWGKFVVSDSEGSSNNLFNIKSSSAHSVLVTTTEYEVGESYKTKASFKKYESIEQSFTDYINLIVTNHCYQAALAHSSDPELYVQELQKAGYATDPDYAEKILAIYHSI